MNTAAPAFLVALETSGFGQGIRSSIWAYPTANVLHVVAVTAFFSAVVVLDLALIGAIGGAERGAVLRGARRAAILLFLLVVATGLVLFTAEASHVALNRVFQAKMLLIALALANALFVGRRAVHHVGRSGATLGTPGWVQRAALVSLLIWIATVAAGRLIAYY